MSLSAEKAMSILRETIEGEFRSPARANATTDSSGGLFPKAAWPKIHWTLPGLALLVSICKIREILAELLVLFGGWLDRAHDFLNLTENLVAESV